MMRQVIAISLAGLRTLPSRLGASVVVVVGVGGVVFVLTALIAMANGLQRALQNTGHPDRVLILGQGSQSEINGSITREQAAIIAGLPGIAALHGADGARVPLASGEIYATVNLPRRRDGVRAGLPLRGVSADAFRVWPEIGMVAGRRFQPGRFEVMVGAGAAGVFAGLDVGDTLSVKGVDLQVVGHFEADGGATESEAWMDVDVMAGAFRRGPFLQSVRARLAEPAALDVLRAAVDGDRRLSSTVLRETDYYQAHSDSSTRLMRLLAAAAGSIMALGAVCGALNALHAAVLARAREIAVLRAIGFSGVAVAVSVLAEALVLCLAGAVLGCAAGWLVFDGMAASSTGATFSEVAFRFDVTPKLLLGGVLVAAAIGLCGAVLPAARAARQRVVDGLRAAR
jgi:putative ABC transport system permease protein